MKRSHITRTLVVLLISLTFLGCPLLLGNDTTPDETETEETPSDTDDTSGDDTSDDGTSDDPNDGGGTDETVIPGKSILHFDLGTTTSQSVSPAGVTALSGDGVPDAVVHVNVLDADPTIAHQSLVDGENEVILDKDGLYLLGFVDVNDAANGGITPIGNLSLAQVGSSSVPLDSDAGDNLYLGTLTFTNGQFETDLSLTELEAGTGYSAAELEEVARFDHTLTRFLNPDVDRNGVWDVDEELWWDFRADYPISLDYEALVVAQPGDPVQSDWLDPYAHPNIVYWSVTRDYVVDSWDDFALDLPPDVDANLDGSPITSVGAYQFDAGFPGSGEFVNFQFFGVWDPLPPFDGDYVVNIGADRYFIDNAQFPQAAEGFEGVPLMLYALYKDEYGVYHQAHVTWRTVVDNQIAIPDMVQVSQRLTHSSIDFGPQTGDTPVTSVHVPTDSDETMVDLSGYELAEDTHWIYPAAITDIAFNQFQFNVHSATGAPDTNIIPYTTGSPVVVDALQGEWLNAAYDGGDLGSRLIFDGSTLDFYMESTDTTPADSPEVYSDRDPDQTDGTYFIKMVSPDADGNPTADAHVAAEVSGDTLTVWFSDTPGVQPDPTASAGLTYQRSSDLTGPTPEGTVATPVIEPSSGSYANEVEVTITTATDSATIHYSTDGGVSYAQYTSPVTVTSDTTITAYATRFGWNDSAETTATYDVFTREISGNFNWTHDLPDRHGVVLLLDTELSAAGPSDVAYAYQFDAFGTSENYVMSPGLENGTYYLVGIYYTSGGTYATQGLAVTEADIITYYGSDSATPPPSANVTVADNTVTADLVGDFQSLARLNADFSTDPTLNGNWDLDFTNLGASLGTFSWDGSSSRLTFNGDGDPALATYEAEQFSEFTVLTDIIITNGNDDGATGILLKSAPEMGSVYFFRIRRNGDMEFIRNVGGTPTTLYTGNTTLINAGFDARNVVTVTTSEPSGVPTFRCFVNGVLQTTIEDTSAQAITGTGDIGAIIAQSSDLAFGVGYDRFIVW